MWHGSTGSRVSRNLLPNHHDKDCISIIPHSFPVSHTERRPFRLPLLQINTQILTPDRNCSSHPHHGHIQLNLLPAPHTHLPSAPVPPTEFQAIVRSPLIERASSNARVFACDRPEKAARCFKRVLGGFVGGMEDHAAELGRQAGWRHRGEARDPRVGVEEVEQREDTCGGERDRLQAGASRRREWDFGRVRCE